MTVRNPTPADQFAERYLDQYAELDPIASTGWGLRRHDDRLPDLSPDGLAERSALRRRTLAELGAVPVVDATDEVTVAALRDELELDEQIRATGAEEAELNSLTSPLQTVRRIFDLMPTETPDDWAVVARRMEAIPAALAGYAASLRLAAARGDISARRQVEAGIQQSRANAEADGFFAQVAAGADTSLPGSVRADLDRAASAAAAAYAELADVLASELLAAAPTKDAVGSAKYALFSQRFIGAAIDLAETYQWGHEELARITELMASTAARIAPGATVQEAMVQLNTDPARMLNGTDALLAWMQDTSDAAIDALAGTHFDIPAPLRRLQCLIAPTHEGGIYYTPPSDDLTRPGRMWWSVPAGVTAFSTWRERTNIYHEGVPGHHLQVGQTVLNRDALNRWRRLASWNSGHGEGWALYAERLMADLGFLDDPADFLGMLDGQSMRAARVVLDIGVHCELPAPAEVGGGAWDYAKAWQFLTSHAAIAEGFLRSELNRYLGWPGQAPAYKVGERLWLALRDDVRAREGDDFDLASFHRRALDLGGIRMNVLRAALLDDQRPGP
jgi:uncharacterized protein (DUF885 family)